VPFAAPLNAGVMPRWRNARALSQLTLSTACSSVVAQAKDAWLITVSGVTGTVTPGGPSSGYSTLLPKPAWRCRHAGWLNGAVKPACTAEGGMISVWCGKWWGRRHNKTCTGAATAGFSPFTRAVVAARWCWRYAARLRVN